MDNKFDINRDYKMIFDNIEGLFVIDKDERIIYMADQLAKLHGYRFGYETYGKKIREVMPEDVNHLYKTIKSGRSQVGEIYFFEGDLLVSNDFPIIKDGEVAGALEYDTFSNAAFLQSFLNKLYSKSSKLEFYKEEYSNTRGTKYSIEDIIGESDEIIKLKERIQNVARSSATALIQGETGSGKELVANAIHSSSLRTFKEFVKVNCSTIPENLFESELFGYEEGSFTGAKVGGKRGKIEIASGGTLFLDEIDQLSLTEQPKLLRFLQNKEIAKVGNEKDVIVDVRVVVATNKDLLSLVKEGKFREDLYYRLNAIEVIVPPLRERKDDISILSESIIQKLNLEIREKDSQITQICDNALSLLKDYSWPGNVRELQNVIERACYETNDTVLKVEHLEDFVIEKAIYDTNSNYSGFLSLEEIRENAEKEAIVKILEYCNGNRTKASKILNLSRQNLFQKINKYDIDY